MRVGVELHLTPLVSRQILALSLFPLQYLAPLVLLSLVPQVVELQTLVVVATGFGGNGGGAGGHEGPGYWNGRPGGAWCFTGIDVIFFGSKSKTITMTNNDNFDFFHAGQIIQAPYSGHVSLAFDQ